MGFSRYYLFKWYFKTYKDANEVLRKKFFEENLNNIF